MTHPIPPPEPPAVVQTLKPEVTSSTSSNPTPADVGQETSNQLSLPTPVESLPSETVVLGAPKRAELLGTPVPVGYGIKPVEAKDSSEFVAPPGSIQPLRVAEDNNSTIAKLKKFATNPASSDTAQAPLQLSEENSNTSVVTPSGSIQPLRVAEDNDSTIAKLKKFTTSQAATEQTVPSNQPELPPTSPPIPNNEQQPVIQPPLAPAPEADETPIQIQIQPSAPTAPTTTSIERRIIELTSDSLVYDEQRKIVTAEGKVLLRFNGGVLDADRLQVNLPNQIAVGEGNVALTRGEQVLRGERFTFNMVQNSGELLNARGEIYIPSAGTDFSGTLPSDVAAGTAPPRPPSDRTTANQPPGEVTSSGGVTFGLGAERGGSNLALPRLRGNVKRLRFEAEGIDFYPEGWQARNARITNDPFSPPELEIRADTVTLTRETPYLDRIRTTRQRLVFDQGPSVPIPKNQAVIDRREREPSPGGIAQIGYDGEDRGGLYVERSFNTIDTERVQLSLTPQFFTQEAVTESGGNLFDSSLYGLRSRLDVTLGPKTSLRGVANFTNLDISELSENLRSSLRLRQTIGNRLPHTLALEYSYRDRLYNGSLGYRTVRSSVGGVFSSPNITLGRTGLNLSYQAGAQYINADTDRSELIDDPTRFRDRVSLSRFQGSAALSRGFLLWQGKALPATATQGLRYTPVPLVPYLQFYGGVRGTSSLYSNGDSQTSLTGTIGLQGQLGHFSRRVFDYTNFNISYSQTIRNGRSPFLFDRDVDTSVLTVGVTQQIYGPFRLGIQASLNLDSGESYSTDYILQYNRRTYGITLRFNPERELGSLNLRISDFNWSGGSDPFSDSEVKPVSGGVSREND